MAAFVIVVLALILWLIYGGAAGKSRGLVIQNLRSDEVILLLADGQTARFEPGQSRTVFARKSTFPQTMRLTDTAGNTLFEQNIEYQALVDAEFRVAIGEQAILFPALPKPS